LSLQLKASFFKAGMRPAFQQHGAKHAYFIEEASSRNCAAKASKRAGREISAS